jgi:aminopeptidase YwaD
VITAGARLARAAIVCAVAAGVGAQVPRPAPPPAAIEDLLPRRVDRIAGALSAGFDRRQALETVTFMDRFWRNAGNAGFNASLDHVRGRLLASGFRTRASNGSPSSPIVWTEEYPAGGRGWDYERGTLWIAGENDPVLSREGQRNALCINSFSTAAGGVEAPLVDVGAGRDADFAGQAVEGAVVLGDAEVGALWRSAVQARGAIGVVSTALARYATPDPPGAPATPRAQWNILQWGSIPYDEARRGFAFKATPRAADRLRARRRDGAVRVRVEIASSFTNAPARTLIAEIPGRTLPDERIVMAAHVQEPGANDDASGCATLAETARAIALAIARGDIPPPSRTLTFLWVDEIRGSRQWLADHADQARGVQRMFSLDMTGEDTSKTGGTFLIEKSPDPSAVWDRPSDPHTEWGKSDVKAASLKGDLLNDVFLAVCRRIARRDGWIVRTNPYEGGSDHTVFGGAGVPSVLAWHFTDRFYHTNLDRPDKTSAAEMQRIGTAVGTSALLLSSGDPDDALAIGDLILAAARSRMTLEAQQGRDIVVAASDRVAAGQTEDDVRSAWLRWYVEALESVRTLSGSSNPRIDRLIAQGSAEIRRIARDPR